MSINESYSVVVGRILTVVGYPGVSPAIHMYLEWHARPLGVGFEGGAPYSTAPEYHTSVCMAWDTCPLVDSGTRCEVGHFGLLLL